MRDRGPKVVERSRKLRGAMSLPEKVLWYRLRAHRMGFQVKRQHALDGYYLDFYVDAANLCIEIDGSQHESEIECDEHRDARLRELDILTVRVSALNVLKNTTEVVGRLYRI